MASRRGHKGVSLIGFDEKMSSGQLVSWLTKQLNRPPEQFDLYNVGKLLYQSGSYVGAAKLLQIYVDGAGRELPGMHLLGYAYHMLGKKEEAIENLKKVVNNGFDADWQLLVELQVQVEREEAAAKKEAEKKALMLGYEYASNDSY